MTITYSKNTVNGKTRATVICTKGCILDIFESHDKAALKDVVNSKYPS